MNVNQAISKYVNELQPSYKLFSTKIQELISTILETNKIKTHSITSREKSPISLKNKISREGKSYEDPLSEITDLAGVRIITYFPSDVDKILPILETEFSIDKTNSIDKRKISDPSSFGYVSVHLVVKLSEARYDLPEYVNFKNLKCEIQVRTILQHAWAEIEHDIVYKSSEEIPFQLRRRFASLSGLLEMADREFEQLKHEEVEVRESIEKTISKEDLNIPINLVSLSFYLKKYHKEKSPRGRIKFTNMLKMLYDLKISSLQSLHSILTEESLQYADVELADIRDVCPEPNGIDECLLRYFIAIANKFGLSREKIAEYAECPAFENPEKDKKRILKRGDLEMKKNNRAMK